MNRAGVRETSDATISRRKPIVVAGGQDAIVGTLAAGRVIVEELPPHSVGGGADFRLGQAPRRKFVRCAASEIFY